MIDDFIAHGITTLQSPVPMPHEQARYVESYAMSRGMSITYYFERPAEQFGRDEPPKISLYAPEYEQAVRNRLMQMLPALDPYPRLQHAFMLQDEPFHAGIKSFGHTDQEKAAFEKKYGYRLVNDDEGIRMSPTVWQDVLTFRSDYFPVVAKTTKFSKSSTPASPSSSITIATTSSAAVSVRNPKSQSTTSSTGAATGPTDTQWISIRT